MEKIRKVTSAFKKLLALNGGLKRENEMTFVKKFADDESGASAAEYALILIVVGVAIITGATTLATAVGGAMTRTAGTINNNVATI